MMDNNSLLSEEEKQAARKAYLAALTQDVCTVTFTKRDGSERVMKCTLREDLLPKQIDIEEHTQAKSTRNNLLNVVVFDLEAQGWRTFNIDRVVRVEVEASNAAA